MTRLKSLVLLTIGLALGCQPSTPIRPSAPVYTVAPAPTVTAPTDVPPPPAPLVSEEQCRRYVQAAALHVELSVERADVQHLRELLGVAERDEKELSQRLGWNMQKPGESLEARLAFAEAVRRRLEVRLEAAENRCQTLEQQLARLD